ncbi:hypothetical protein PBY51_011231 [Eleginops maclovinus]|uniref:Uncharacterized protein n=1 Tax=Eleginops maclovinus TaxID=56733 RepID=A0AAN7XAV7_ELEMC|nr:hypothetical protein PBY51_011231 [Eleginops maclovinus]
MLHILQLKPPPTCSTSPYSCHLDRFLSQDLDLESGSHQGGDCFLSQALIGGRGCGCGGSTEWCSNSVCVTLCLTHFIQSAAAQGKPHKAVPPPPPSCTELKRQCVEDLQDADVTVHVLNVTKHSLNWICLRLSDRQMLL